MADTSPHGGSSGAVSFMPMTESAMLCGVPVLVTEFDRCRIPGGVDFWSRGGFYSPGVCFSGYVPLCTQTTEPSGGWPLQAGETAVRCVPEAYDCNADGGDQRYATSDYAGTILSAPAFEIRWRSADLKAKGTLDPPPAPTSRNALPGVTVKVPATTWPRRSTDTASAAEGGASSPSAGLPHLGPGSIAAIAVGGGLGLLVVALVAVLWTARRRRRRRNKADRSTITARLGSAGGLEPAPGREALPVEMEHMPTGPRELSAGPEGQSAVNVSGLFEMDVGSSPKHQ